jgi:SAM-dependent methyltransferase
MTQPSGAPRPHQTLDHVWAQRYRIRQCLYRETAGPLIAGIFHFISFTNIVGWLTMLCHTEVPMDLRSRLDTSGVESAAAVLNYQPFILADDVQTGAAYSWCCGADPRVKPPLLFRRTDYAEQWDYISDINGRLRAMYDDLLDEVACRYPGGSLLDPACNNGYFPVGAELRGMRGFGMDLGDHGPAVRLLNAALGTDASFSAAGYDSRAHRLPVDETFDVCVISAIMCHLPDPLNFLAESARVARKAILFWGQIVDTEALVVAYQPPHASLSTLLDFPYCFNDNTRISMGIFREAMRLTGFADVTEIPSRPTWLPGLFDRPFPTLEQELLNGSRHVVLLATR